MGSLDVIKPAFEADPGTRDVRRPDLGLTAGRSGVRLGRGEHQPGSPHFPLTLSGELSLEVFDPPNEFVDVLVQLVDVLVFSRVLTYKP